MHLKLIYGVIFLFIQLLGACHTYKETYVKTPESNLLNHELPDDLILETVYLVGDAGSYKILNNKVLFNHLAGELQNEKGNVSLVYLGDNVYNAGLTEANHPDCGEKEQILNVQLNMARHFDGETYFIPGNHDWNNASAGGLEAVKRQEDYVESYFDDREVNFYPNRGCGDPVVKEINEDLMYIFLDSQWWLQKWEDEPEINVGCKIASREEFVNELQQIFSENKEKQLVVFIHHPFYSNGPHGAKFSLKSHVFPLTDFNKKLWIPLPVIGSMLPLARKAGITRQDLTNKHYKSLKKEVLSIIQAHENVIFASGHDHSLQYFHENNNHFIVSGAGAKLTYAQKGGKAEMVRSTNGYGKLYFFKSGAVWLDFVMVDNVVPTGELIFRKQLVSAK
jgi:hypothetical protein